MRRALARLGSLIITPLRSQVRLCTTLPNSSVVTDPLVDEVVNNIWALGNEGRVEEAMDLIENMPSKPPVDVWEAMMLVARANGVLGVSDMCQHQVELLDPSRITNRLQAGLLDPQVLDPPPHSTDHQPPLVSFAGVTKGPDYDVHCALQSGLIQQMISAGYCPKLDEVWHDVSSEEAAESLLDHCERKSLTEGLLTTPARSPLYITKSLRTCPDCHEALKIISKLTGRRIYSEDPVRWPGMFVHLFENGSCSCGDVY